MFGAQQQSGFNSPPPTAQQPQPSNQWATFNSPQSQAAPSAFPTAFPNNNMSAGGSSTGFPAANTGFGGGGPAAPATNPMTGFPSNNSPFGGGPAPAASPFRTDPFGGGGAMSMQQPPPQQQQPGAAMSANWSTMANSSNPFNDASSGGVFGGPAPAMGGQLNGSSVNSAFATSPLTPTTTQVATQDTAQPNKRQDMFSGLVDSFGVEFGSKKEPEPLPKMNELASQQQQPAFGYGVSDGDGESDNVINEEIDFTKSKNQSIKCDPFDISNVQINAKEMEMGPNVYTKTISFSESESDLTPDRDIPAPTLPPPPLPTIVNNANFPNDDSAPTPPPRPSISRPVIYASKNIGLYSNVPDQLTSAQVNEVIRSAPSGTMPPNPLARGMTVDLGNYPESPPPPPPPRPGSRASGAVTAIPRPSYSTMPRVSSSSLSSTHQGASISPPVLFPAADRTNSPHSSPKFSRQMTLPASAVCSNVTASSPKLHRQTTLQHSVGSTSVTADAFAAPNTPPVDNATHITTTTSDLQFNNSSFSTSFSNSPKQDQVKNNNLQFEANFADFSNFPVQDGFSEKGSNMVSEAEDPPPPPPRPGSGRKKGPMLAAGSRAMTLPASSVCDIITDSHNSEDKTRSSVSAVMEEGQKGSSCGVDPFAVALSGSKPSGGKSGRNVDSQYARPRPRPRSKTPTLISTKTSLSMALKSDNRSDSPVSQNSACSRQNSNCSREMEVFASSDTHLSSSSGSGSIKQQQQRYEQTVDSRSHSSNSPREARRLGSRDSHPHPRTGTPVSVHSAQSISSGQSLGEQTADPFAHVDPFETNKECEDPFGEKDPFEGSDPFQSPTDPFSKELQEAEFKTKVIALTIDGLEVSGESTTVSNSNTPVELKADPDPFLSDPFSSLVSDPFHEKAKIGLDQPLFGLLQNNNLKRRSFDPFDTAHATDTLSKTSVTPEFSNTFDSGIVANKTGSDVFSSDFTNDEFYNAKNIQHNLNTDNNQKQGWTADFNSSNPGALKNQFQFSNDKSGVKNGTSNQYSVNHTSQINDHIKFSPHPTSDSPTSYHTSHLANNLNQSQFSNQHFNCDSPSNISAYSVTDSVEQSHLSNIPHNHHNHSDSPASEILGHNSSTGSDNLNQSHFSAHHPTLRDSPMATITTAAGGNNSVYSNNIHQHNTSASGSDQSSSSTSFQMHSRQRHESDSTSYNSEISEAFAPTTSSHIVTPPASSATAVPSHVISVNNGRGTPGNPFINSNGQVIKIDYLKLLLFCGLILF